MGWDFLSAPFAWHWQELHPAILTHYRINKKNKKKCVKAGVVVPAAKC